MMRQRTGRTGVCWWLREAAVAVIAAAAAWPVGAQVTPPAPAPQAQRQRAPQFVSPEVASDGRISFRLYAPRAQAVVLSASDISGMAPGSGALAKADNGVWEVTVGPVPPGAYRYTFTVDGVATIDPRNPATSESNNNTWSLVLVPGSDLFDVKDVPHGAVAEVVYTSTTLGRFRRMHVYTPPGYERNRTAYPVFYLLHGAGDCDDSWTSVGRAHVILDNLIAAGKARPMIVVMPAGHTSRSGASAIGRNATEDFVNDFAKDLMPYVESHYRLLTRRDQTAIAGLSMGGGHTLNVAIPRLDRFGYIGVYSSGLLGAFPELAARNRPAAAPPPAVPPAATPPATAPTPTSGGPQTAADWEKQHAAMLGNASLKRGLRLFWFATGKDDFLLTTTRATVDLFEKHGFSPEYHESNGGHTWLNWRDYLAAFAPRLFQAKARSGRTVPTEVGAAAR